MLFGHICGRVYSLAEAALMLGVYEAQLLAAIRCGQLVGRQVGATWFFTAESLRRYREQRRANGATM